MPKIRSTFPNSEDTMTLCLLSFLHNKTIIVPLRASAFHTNDFIYRNVEIFQKKEKKKKKEKF